VWSWSRSAESNLRRIDLMLQAHGSGNEFNSLSSQEKNLAKQIQRLHEAAYEGQPIRTAGQLSSVK
jgi:hypothetical protein